VSDFLPRAQSRLVDSTGKPTREFYHWFQSVVAGLEGQISDLSAIVQGLVNISTSLGSPDGQTQNIIDVVAALNAKANASVTVSGVYSLTGGGPLSDDVALMLRGDQPEPGASMMYGTDADGNPGWQVQAIPSFATTDDLAEGTTNLYFTDERAQDAVGAILADTGDVPLAYDPDTRTISARSNLAQAWVFG
jgi:hypothetical protein